MLGRPILVLTTLVLAAFDSAQPVALAATCEQTAENLQRRYAQTPAYCSSDSAPGFLCSGVVLRGTEPAARDGLYNTWDADAPTRLNDAVSYAFLRSDANFKRLTKDHQSGYILYPIMELQAPKHRYEVLCAYPVDGGTAERSEAGCGTFAQAADPSIGRSCHTQGILDGRAWVTHYEQSTQGDNRNACGFAVNDALNQQAVSNFNAALQAMRNKRSLFFRESELRIKDWSASTPVAQLPIESFFYIAGNERGLANARLEQHRYFRQSNIWVPIIAVTLPQSRSAKAQFVCQSSDQAIAEGTPTPINEYVQLGEWIRRNDVGSEGVEWSLSLEPTPLGREQSTPQGYARMYAEIRRKYGNDYQWLQNDGGGMYRQLVCHLNIARDKDRYNLEPFRHDLSQEDSDNAGCNPVRILEQGKG
ncbi:DUF2599 domain-containing protein [Pseudomonas sichuanensis]|uniref:DUF2599 domain-containing protein n=1 Tax=Pseudomonas sichuanensis TaxID=2213015 RepID=UPI002ABA6502|nr:DUF2599 domain-containing protein [Pseudomonas sichuanensis]MDZ4021199.1 hypothetical protein [Pseudomonas sichuanensis]